MALDDIFTRLTSALTDAESPITESMFQNLVSNTFHNKALIASDGTEIAAGDADAVGVGPNSAITDNAPTAGLVANIQVGMQIEITSGVALGLIVNVVSVASPSFTVDADLPAAGVIIGDTYIALYGLESDLAHDHDGVSGRKVNILNITTGTDPFTQDQIDGIIDPNGNRINAVDINNPFATLADVAAMAWVDDGTQVINDVGGFPVTGLVSISSQVPVGTAFAQMWCLVDGGTQGSLGFRVPGVGTYRTVMFSQHSSGDQNGSTAWVPVNGSRQIDRESTATGAQIKGEVRSYL